VYIYTSGTKKRGERLEIYTRELCALCPVTGYSQLVSGQYICNRWRMRMLVVVDRNLNPVLVDIKATGERLD
jgi:hypothetical protein